MCPTPSTWRRPNHEEPRRSDTFRSGNGKSLWQLWLLFTRMSGLVNKDALQCPPGSSFGRVGVLPENLSRSHLCPRFLCTSVSSAPLAKSKYQFPCLVVFKKKKITKCLVLSERLNIYNVFVFSLIIILG